MMGFLAAATVFCALVAIGLWVYGRRARRENVEIKRHLVELKLERPSPLPRGAPFTPPGMRYISLGPKDPPPPPGMDLTAQPVAAFQIRRRPEGVWVVAGTWSEQPVQVMPNARSAELLAYWMSCDEVCVTHEVRYLTRGETNPILAQVNRRIRVLATQADMDNITKKLEALPPDSLFTPLPAEVAEQFRRDFERLYRRGEQLP